MTHVSDSPETDNHGFLNHARMTNSCQGRQWGYPRGVKN